MPDSEDTVDPLPLLDELRAMAQTGLHFADNPYERERYERMLALVSEYYGRTFEKPPEQVRDSLADHLGEQTPKVAAFAAVFDDDRRILVIERSDGLGWGTPAGKLDMGETPARAAERETREETGVEVEAVELVDTYAVEPPKPWPAHSIAHLYLCRRVGGEVTTTHESDRTEYRFPDDVPEWATEYYPEMVADALAAHRRR